MCKRVGSDAYRTIEVPALRDRALLSRVSCHQRACKSHRDPLTTPAKVQKNKNVLETESELWFMLQRELVLKDGETSVI